MSVVFKINPTWWTKLLVWWYGTVLNIGKRLQSGFFLDRSTVVFVAHYEVASATASFHKFWNDDLSLEHGESLKGIVPRLAGFDGPVIALIIYARNGALRLVYGRMRGRSESGVYLASYSERGLAIQQRWNMSGTQSTVMHGERLNWVLEEANLWHSPVKAMGESERRGWVTQDHRKHIEPPPAESLQEMITRRNFLRGDPVIGRGMTNPVGYVPDRVDARRQTTDDSDGTDILVGAVVGLLIAEALDDTPPNASPEPVYTGNGGNFSGAGASDTWDAPVAEAPRYEAPVRVYEEPEPTRYESPSYGSNSDSGSSDSSSSSDSSPSSDF